MKQKKTFLAYLLRIDSCWYIIIFFFYRLNPIGATEQLYLTGLYNTPHSVIMLKHVTFRYQLL